MDLKSCVFIFIFLSFLPLGFSQEATTKAPLPKWEVGLATGYFYLPDYPGAAQSRSRILSLPYVVYRGDFFRADRSGMRGLFFNNEKVDFDLSFNAGFPSRSRDNDARAGMSDLDWIGEIGPRMVYHIYKSSSLKPIVRVDAKIPVRAVFSSDLSRINATSRGFLFNPELTFRHRALFSDTSLFVLNVGGLWGTEILHDYFYEVKQSDVTADRPQYDAKGGFMGLEGNLSFVKSYANGVSVYFGVSKNYYSEAKNTSSPLLKDKETDGYYLGLAWDFYKSDEHEAKSD